MNKIIILIIDDEKAIRKMIRLVFEPQGYVVHEAESGQTGIIAAADCRPDVIILDLGLKDMDGKDVLVRLREWCNIPILILSIRQEVEDKVAALDAGADDYLVKPFHTAELSARIRMLLRHTPGNKGESSLHCGGIEIDFLSHRVFVNNKELRLTSTEFSLLRTLMGNHGKIVTHRQLLNSVWGPHAGEQAQYARVYVNHLRKKLYALDPARKFIITDPGIGYRFCEEGTGEIDEQ